MNEKIAKSLLEWIAQNMQSVPFLYTDARANVDVKNLLDKIAELRGIDPIENGKQFNDIADSIEYDKKRSTQQE